jgi:Sec-independent protein translocase protein TatA
MMVSFVKSSAMKIMLRLTYGLHCILVKFGVTNLQNILLSIGGFRENRRGETRSFLVGVNNNNNNKKKKKKKKKKNDAKQDEIQHTKAKLGEVLKKTGKTKQCMDNTYGT